MRKELTAVKKLLCFGSFFHCVILGFKLICTVSLFIVTASEVKGIIHIMLSVLLILSLSSINIPGMRTFAAYWPLSLASLVTALIRK